MTKVFNVNIVGNLTNDNGVLSGFSVNDYATLPETLEGLTINNLEIVFKFKTNSLTSNNAIFWTDKLTDDPSIPWAGIRLCNYNVDNSVFDLEVTDNNTQIAEIYDTTAILPNKYYYIKALYNDTDGYSLYKSEDGKNYTLIGVNATTDMPPNSQALIGRAVDTDPIPLDGSIDLNESYIKVNGVIWWKGAENITKIQLRHDTAANWTSVNPILLEGEVGIETDTRKQKFGDGVTAWNSLPYDKGSTALQNITSSNVTNALGYTPVNKAGDTMTGGLSTRYLNTSNDINLGGDGRMNLKINGTSKGTTPTSNSYQAFLFNDTDSSHTTWQSHRFGACEVQVLNTGENRLILSAYKNEANSTAAATLTLGVQASGSAWCTFPNTSCCDGQWVDSFHTLSTSTAQGNYEIDVSSFLPSDRTSYDYEIMVHFTGSRTSGSTNTYVTISKSLLNITLDENWKNASVYGSANFDGDHGEAQSISCIVIARKNVDKFYFNITRQNLNNSALVMTKYRRIGTNA